MFRIFALAFLIVGLTACNKGLTTAQAQGPDPSYDNLAPAYSDYGATDDYTDYADDGGQVIETAEAPPPLPEYDQPEIPGDDYYWTPGYWAWSPGGYYWVPGAWVLAPYVGAVWTPPYWAFEVNYYRWHPGYWGSHVGFYGGIDYGFGYTGRGYYGAYWNGGHLRYNRAVTRVNVNIVRNVYNYSVPRGTVSRVSFNGGRGGINVRPTPQERAVVRDRRMPAIAAQTQHAREAANNRSQFAQAGRLGQNAAVASRQLNTNYQTPAAQPPAAARIAPQRPQARGPDNRPIPAARDNRLELGPAAPQQQARPDRQRGGGRFDQRPAQQVAPQPVPQQAAPAPVPAQERRGRGPENRTAPTMRPVPQAAPQPVPQQVQPAPQRHDARPENRPAQVAQPAPHAQPQPQQRPAAPPRMREPQQRAPQPQQAAPPAPQAGRGERGGGRGNDNKGR